MSGKTNARHVRIVPEKRTVYDTAYPGIGHRDRLRVVNRVNVPPGDYVAPLVGVAWLGRSVAWLYERDVVEA